MREIEKRCVRYKLKKEYDIPEDIYEYMEEIDYAQDDCYAYLLERLVQKLLKERALLHNDEENDNLRARWVLKIPIDMTRIHHFPSETLVKNKTLKKFIESLEPYEWIKITLENKIMEVEDDAICWGFIHNDAGSKGIMTVQKDNSGNYIYEFDSR